MVPRALLLLLLLPPLLLGGSAALPAPRRARRHSDGMFTSELSRLRESARLQRLLQGLVGKRSEHDPENTTTWNTSAEGRLCLPRPAGHAHPAGLDAPECPPGSGQVSLAASWMETWGHGFRAGHPCC